MRCTAFTRKAFLCGIVFVNILILYLMFRRQKSEDPSHQEREISAHPKAACKPSITFIINEFEDFGNNVLQTAETIANRFPQCPVLIVAERLPYPQINLKEIDSDYVKLITTKVSPEKPFSVFQPINYITSDYVLFVPDGTLIDSRHNISRMVSSLQNRERSDIQFIAAGTDSILTYSNCLKIEPNMKEWTLTYSKFSNGKYCDGVEIDSVLLVHSNVMKNFTDAFMRPFRESVFIQGALRKWKVKLSEVSFRRNLGYLSTDHKKWRHNVYEKERLRILYKTFGFKKVVRQSSVEEWYGCEKDTTRCFGSVYSEMPDFIFEERWTPPCCLRHLRETAKHVFTILDNAGVRYWLEGGSLLGAARTGDIIPWDYDVDIGIYQEDITKLPILKNCELQPIADDDGFIWQRSKQHEGDFYRVQYSDKNQLHVDLYPFFSKNGNMTKNSWMKTHRQDCEFPERFLKPLTKISFAGLQASAPNNVRQFLELKFGKGVIENPQYPDPNRKKFKDKNKKI